MTGGTLYLFDPHTAIKGHLSGSAPTPRRLTTEDAEELAVILAEHISRTRSVNAAAIIDDWDEALRRFWVLRPDPPEIADAKVTDTVSVSLPA
jgi:glutamate synthase domain-containing protein 3